MAQLPEAALTIWRRRQVEDASGYSRSTIYLRIRQGLWPKPVRLGARVVGWPASEVAAVNAARVAGLTEDEIRTMVSKLEAGRRSALRIFGVEIESQSGA
jgi:prophage regulatory protein